MRRRFRHHARAASGFGIAATIWLLGGCATSGGSAPPDDAPIVVTFQVIDETFKALLVDPADIEIAQRLMAGEEAPSIPNGLIVHETGVNAPWSWSLDPDDIEFADATTEVCDALPSDVEDGIITSDRFCPWAAQVVAIEPGP